MSRREAVYVVVAIVVVVMIWVIGEQLGVLSFDNWLRGQGFDV